MTTYVYETIPSSEGARPRRFEVRQSMRDAALTHHPETGEPVRRVIIGGFGFISGADSRQECPEGGYCDAPDARSSCCCGQASCSH